MNKLFGTITLFLLLAGLVTPVLGQDAPDTDMVSALLSAGSQMVTLGDVLMNEPFDNDQNWPAWDDGNMTASLKKGVYHMTVEGNFYSWQLSADSYQDVVIQVNTRQDSKTLANDYGVMCRADSDGGKGYYFLITGDGYYAILKLSNPDNGRQVLVEWATSDAINQGRENNTITAACVGDYLALYANGTLLAETTDDEFSEGTVGLTVGAYADKSLTDIGFDNLVLWSASARKGANMPKDDGAKGDNAPITIGSLADMLAAGEQAVTLGDVLMDEPFDTDEHWPTFDDGAGFTGVLDEGAYRLSIEGNFYSWQTSEESYDDVVIQVDTRQNSKIKENNFGVMCRASGRSGTGYYFLISGDGYYTIMKLVNPDDGREQLVKWAASDAINKAPESNTITAVCVGNYLSLYANGVLLAETHDDEFSQGRVAVTVGSFDDNATTDISFDNLMIQAASAK